MAWPGAPTILSTAQQSGCAGVLFAPRKIDTTLPLLAWANGDADAHLRTISPGGKALADLAFRTLLIGQALAVGAVRPRVPDVKQAAQRRLTLRARPAVPPVRHQAQ